MQFLTVLFSLLLLSCLEQPQIVDNDDRDNDSIKNTTDACPDVAGVIENNGCPVSLEPAFVDSDNDKVEDKNDLCPNSMGVVDANGCALSQLDSDKDGVNDAIDLCDMSSGTVDANGCSLAQLDSDNDSVNDAQDLCPSEIGLSENNGCPENQIALGFDSLQENFELSEGESLELILIVSNESLISKAELFLNDQLIRPEGVAPFTWNVASENQTDLALQNLAVGDYELKVVVTDVDAQTHIFEMNFSVIEDNSNEPEPVEPELEQQVAEILKADCTSASCHDATPGGARIDLVTGTMEDFAKRLVGQPSGSNKCVGELMVDPAHGENSLLLKLVDSTNGDQCIAKMPFGKQGVSQDDYEILKKWVEQLIVAAPPIVTLPPEPTKIEPVTLNKTQGFSIAHFAKKIILGQPLDSNEYDLVTNNNQFNEDAYKQLVESWIQTDQFKIKIRQFLRKAMQQNSSPLTTTFYWEQFGGLGYSPDAPVSTEKVQDALHEMMVLTALRIIDNDEDFRTILTTRDWELSTILIAALNRADQQNIKPQNDELRLKNMPGVLDSDYTDYRTIRINQNDTPPNYENSTAYINNLRALSDGDSIDLLAPRVGYFNSPAFIFNWQTNTSNQFRLPLNQTLITALGLSFEAGDTTMRNHEEGVFDSHAKPGTDCYACHSQMDPMRNVFLKYYHTKNTRALSQIGDERPDFSFHGLSREVTNMDEFAQALADHPNFAFAWAANFCQWVTSNECAEKYPDDVEDIAQKFKASNFNFNTLVIETFMSPLVLNSVTDNSEMNISIARQDHICSHLDGGLSKIADERSRSKEKIFCDKSIHYIAAETDLIPNDEYTRGKVSLLQPTQLDPFYVKSVEYLCAARDWWFIGNNDQKPFNRNHLDQVFDDMTTVILGVPQSHEHYSQARSTIEKVYDVLRTSPECTDPNQVNLSDNATPSCGYSLSVQQALETVWKMSCSSPSTISVGIGF